MKNSIAVTAAVAMATLWAAGCATSQSGSKALQQQVASLESQVSALNARVEELSGRLESPEAASRGDLSGSESRSRAASLLTARQIQLALKNAGFYGGSIDGKLGPKTREAVRAFQRSNGLTADGRVGSKTSGALAKYLSKE